MTTCNRLSVAAALAVALASSALTPVYHDLGWLLSVLGAIVAVASASALARLAHAPRALLPVPDAARRPMDRLHRLLRAVRAAVSGDAGTAEQVLWALWETSGLARRLEQESVAGGARGALADRALDAVLALFDAAARYVDRLPHGSVLGFVDDVEAQEVPGDTLAQRTPEGDAVRVMTAHASKGLEWPLVVVAGKEYGTGSSRDWAAKGTNLLGVRAVITESFERIHRSNLVGMGVLPLQFAEGVTRETLGLDGSETFTIRNVATLRPRQDVEVELVRADGRKETFTTRCRIDTVNELEYFLNGGILHYVLRKLAA